MDMTRGVIYYAGRKRIGNIGFSQYCCFVPMQRYQLTSELVAEAFRYGREVEPNKIVYASGDQLIVLIYARDYTCGGVFRGNLNEIKYIIITCWVQKNR